MDLRRHKIPIIANLVFMLICLTSPTKSDVLKQSDEESMVTECRGVPGRDGRDGRDGMQGPYGLPGHNGLSAEFERKFEEILTALTERLRTVESGLTSPPRERIEHGRDSHSDTPGEKSSGTQDQATIGGVTYVRWGRNVCPPKTLKVYSGFVAGSHYTHAGSGANHLCLPMNPQWNKTVAGRQNAASLYGTEFQLEVNPGFYRKNADGKSQHDYEALCAVCQSLGRLNHLMIPARLECPSGWNLEYLGFLMASHAGHKRSEFVCVDQDPDVHQATSPNVNGNLFYAVEVVCGALPCPPYVDGYEVTCVVCTQ